MVLGPRLSRFDVTFHLGDEAHRVEVWSDMSALEAVRLVTGRAGAPSRCESGICGTCESDVDGERVRLCATSARRIDGRSVILPGSSAPAAGDPGGNAS